MDPTCIRNIALTGAAGAGKTLLAEALLFAAGATRAKGSIERGSTVSDFDPQERVLGHSLEPAVLTFEHAGTRLHLLDTPGYADFLPRTFAALDPASPAAGAPAPLRAPLPPHPERDLLWFMAEYAPEMESWERDVFLAVREESFYFYPVFATQIMNEGWASYWHARLLREADFIPQQAYLDAIRCHSEVVRPVAADEQVALSVNPYHLGFSLWEHIVARRGLDAAFAIRTEDDDFAFIRNHLTRDLVEELGLFRYRARDGRATVLESDLDALHEAILAPKYHFGAPAMVVRRTRPDGTLELGHDHRLAGRGLDLDRSRKVLEYVQRLWRRPVRLVTVDEHGAELELSVP